LATWASRREGREVGVHLRRAFERAVGRGRPDTQGVSIAGDVGQTGDRLDVDQTIVVQETLFHR
jgi:hypothetical protein